MTPKEYAENLKRSYYGIAITTPGYANVVDSELARRISIADTQGKIDLIYSLPISKEFGPIEEYVGFYKDVIKELELM